MLGSGTQLDPYQITTVDEWNLWRGTAPYNATGKFAKLMNNLGPDTGIQTKSTVDGGGFDGGGFLIDCGSPYYPGLFGTIKGGAVIKNLGVRSYVEKDSAKAGGTYNMFATTLISPCTITKCWTDGRIDVKISGGSTIQTAVNISGFVGEISGTTGQIDIEDCLVNTSLYGRTLIGPCTVAGFYRYKASTTVLNMKRCVTKFSPGVNVNNAQMALTTTFASGGGICPNAKRYLRAPAYTETLPSNTNMATYQNCYHGGSGSHVGASSPGNFADYSKQSNFVNFDFVNDWALASNMLSLIFPILPKIEDRTISTWAKPAKKTIVRASHYGISSVMNEINVFLEIETLSGKRESIILTTSVNITSNLLKNVLLRKELKSFLEGINTETQTKSKSARELCSTMKPIKTKALATNNNTIIVWANDTQVDGIIYRLKVLPSIRHFVFPESSAANNICKAMDIFKRSRFKVITTKLEKITSKSIPVVTTMNLKMFITVGMQHFKSTVTAVGNVKKYRILVATIGNITSSVGLNGTLKVSRTIKTFAPQIKSSYLKQININRNITVNSNTIISVIRVKGFTVNDRIIDASMGAINTFIVKNVETYREVKSTLMDCNTSVSPYNENFRFVRVQMIRITKGFETKRPFVYGKISTKERVIIPSTRERVIIQTSNERKVPINIM